MPRTPRSSWVRLAALAAVLGLMVSACSNAEEKEDTGSATTAGTGGRVATLAACACPA